MKNFAGVLVIFLAACAPVDEAQAAKTRPEPVLITKTSEKNKPPRLTSATLGSKPTDKKEADATCTKILNLESPGSLKSRADLKMRFLDAHNQVRKLYGLASLEWDQKIADYAQSWANELKSKYKCAMHHRQTLGRTEGKKFGENLFWYATSKSLSPNAFASSPQQATYDWSKECEDWNYTKNSCAPGEQCGHFTQVVWSNTKKVGCGVATCEGGKYGRTEVWVCNYDPPGNMTINNIKQKPF